MDSKRVFLYVALFAVMMALWNAWKIDYPPQKNIEQTTAGNVSNIPKIPTTGSVSSDDSPQPSKLATTVPAAVTPTGRLIHIKTDVLDMNIDTLGGNVVQANFLKYPAALATPDTPYQLLSNRDDKLFVAESGLVSKQGPDSSVEQVVFESEQNEYALKDGEDQLVVNLTWNDNGIYVTKSFTFTRGKYEIAVDYQVDNKTDQIWEGNLFTQLRQKPDNQTGLMHLPVFYGASLSNPQQHYEKVSFKDMLKNNIDKTVQGGWLAMQQQYFLTSWVPEQKTTNHYYSSAVKINKAGDDDTNNFVYTMGSIGPTVKVYPKTSTIIGVKLYTGPQITQNLKAVAPWLDLTIDYGIFWIISTPLFWVMSQIHSVVGNWGVAIILVTLLIKLLFYLPSAKSYRSMAVMRKVQPKIEALKKRYGEDRQRMSKELMDLYKKEKINPLSSCLPLLIQIPVFIGLYWVLIESIQLRQAPFILWIHDLSVKDPYYVLPILNGLMMLLQQKLSPPPPDPTQAKIMMMLPVVFTFLFLNFPAGLVLYWLCNSTLSILQQWYINRKFDNAAVSKRVKDGA